MLHQFVHEIGQKLIRKLPLELIDESERPVAHLNILNLVILGVGRMLRGAMYLVAGTVAKYIAGPATIISCVVDALFSRLSGLCDADFGAWVPRSGSVYLYSLSPWDNCVHSSLAGTSSCPWSSVSGWIGGQCGA